MNHEALSSESDGEVSRLGRRFQDLGTEVLADKSLTQASEIIHLLQASKQKNLVTNLRHSTYSKSSDMIRKDVAN